VSTSHKPGNLLSDKRLILLQAEPLYHAMQYIAETFPSVSSQRRHTIFFITIRSSPHPNQSYNSTWVIFASFRLHTKPRHATTLTKSVSFSTIYASTYTETAEASTAPSPSTQLKSNLLVRAFDVYLTLKTFKCLIGTSVEILTVVP